MWKKDLIIVIDSIPGQFTISILCRTNAGISGWITSVYSPLSYRHRDQFWWELFGLYGLCSECWCIGGDFNVVRWVMDLKSLTRTTSFFLGTRLT